MTTGRDVRARIDPEVRAGLERVLAVVGPDGISGIRDIVARRSKQSELKAMAAEDSGRAAGVDVHDHSIGEPPCCGDVDVGVDVRVYTPHDASTPAPCICYIHGGGLVLGSVDGDDARAAELALATRCVVASIEYRLAPEFPYPVALDDCVRALNWIADHHERLGIEAGRIALYGPSAGGALAVGTALRARDEGGPHIAFVTLASPMLDDRTCEPSTSTNTGFGAWSREANIQAWSAYLGDAYGTDDVPGYAAPARADDLTGLPPTYLDVGDLDLFRDEVITFAARLSQAMVPVELHVHPGGIHGGEHLAPDAELSQRMRRLRTAAITRALGVDEF